MNIFGAQHHSPSLPATHCSVDAWVQEALTGWGHLGQEENINMSFAEQP